MADGGARRRRSNVFRGDAEGGRARDVRGRDLPGMVVLDAIHDIQAKQEPTLAVRWNCKAGRCGSCSAEINGKPRLMCMTRMTPLPRRASRSPSRRCEVVPDHQGSRDRRLAQLRDGQEDPALQAAPARGRRHVADAAGGHRSHPGVPQVHRVLPLPGRVPRHPRPQEDELRGAALPHPPRGARHAPARHARPPRAREGRVQDRHVQHHQVLHRGVPRAHPHHRQRHHPAEGARGRRLLRSGPLADAQGDGRWREGEGESCR